MRWVGPLVFVLLSVVAFSLGYATRPEVQPEPQPEVGKYDRLDALMEYALDGYARGDMQKVHTMSLVLDNLTRGVDLSRLATVPGLRVAMLGALKARCDDMLRLDPEGGAQTEECYASHKAGRFFDEVDVTVKETGWRLHETYTIAEYESRARRAIVLYPWNLNP